MGMRDVITTLHLLFPLPNRILSLLPPLGQTEFDLLHLQVQGSL